LAYDPREKFNLAAAFTHIHKDVARPSEGGVPFHHVSSRLNSNINKANSPDTLPLKNKGIEFKNNLALSGWHEVFDIYMKLRSEAKKYWIATGRESEFYL